LLAAWECADLEAQLGFGALDADPATWTWVDATYNSGHTSDDNDEYGAALTPAAKGSYGYAFRFSATAARAGATATRPARRSRSPTSTSSWCSEATRANRSQGTRHALTRDAADESPTAVRNREQAFS